MLVEFKDKIVQRFRYISLKRIKFETVALIVTDLREIIKGFSPTILRPPRPIHQ